MLHRNMDLQRRISMNGFKEYGEAMLLAHEGNTQIGIALAKFFKVWVGGLRGWLRAMPGTLPPTESFQRK